MQKKIKIFSVLFFWVVLCANAQENVNVDQSEAVQDTVTSSKITLSMLTTRMLN